MEERSKTIMCSVLFLDIVEYSKKSVSGQISLKERFNAFLSVAIRDVPMDDRIILDTGDGAALSFLGDVEDALQVALSMRESLRGEGAHMDPPLLVRMGINLGPVRLVKDINGQPNIVGDGINVAQRIMAFSDPSQILVSRSYYDAVSRLSSEYAGMFHYQGSRTDKHVREHEIYAIGYPGEFTSTTQQVVEVSPGAEKMGAFKQQVAAAWEAAASKLGAALQSGVACVRNATPRQRTIYGGSAAGVAVLALLVGLLMHRTPAPVSGDEAAAPQQEAASETAPAKPVPATEKTATEKPTTETAPPPHKTAPKPVDKKAPAPSKPVETTQQKLFGIPIGKKTVPGYLSITCMEGSSVFVDGFSKGSVGKGALTIRLNPGKHQLTITHTSKSSVYSELVRVKSGQTVRMHPAFCD